MHLPSLFQKGVHLSEPGADGRPCHHLAKESERDDFCFLKVTSYSPRSRSRVRACLTCMFEVCIWTTNIYLEESKYFRPIFFSTTTKNYKSPPHPPSLEPTSCPSPPWPSPSWARPAAAPCSHWTSPQAPRAGPSTVPASPPEGHSESFIGWGEFSVDDYLTLFVARLSCSWRSWSFADCSTFSSACLSSLASRLSIYRREMLYFSGLLMLKY